MDSKRFDNLAKALGNGNNRRSLLKRAAGLAAAAVAVSTPTRTLAGVTTCDDYTPCSGYGEKCNQSGECVCDTYNGYKTCDYDGVCVKEDECCPGYQFCEYDGSCFKDDECCPSEHYCEYDDVWVKEGECCPDEKYCEYEGVCIKGDECWGGCPGYGEVCKHGKCVADDPKEEPKPDKNPNYSKQLARSCQRKCLAAGKKQGRVSAAKLRRTCKRNCARNTR